ncbi:hypothetical protein CEXT_799461 [Caerostris extrusa]|uniref:Uncharacterized protein n=1 Tax=Caerostris extrusa TaxID=172846 RepID=A0AAV4XMC7_CAEEX|nr:hypothetical protein CEXT_799461 [Caerostris extrusa]
MEEHILRVGRWRWVKHPGTTSRHCCCVISKEWEEDILGLSMIDGQSTNLSWIKNVTPTSFDTTLLLGRKGVRVFESGVGLLRLIEFRRFRGKSKK